MIASSSTFRNHLGRAIWDLSRLLHVGEAVAKISVLGQARLPVQSRWG